MDRGADTLVGELRIWDPGAGTGVTLYRTEPGDGPLATTDWGPDGSVAAVRLGPEHAGELPAAVGPGRPPAIVVVAPDGATTEVILTGDPSVFAWGDRWMAVMDERGGATVFVDRETGRRELLAGWRPVVWSPDGEQLLVKDAGTRRTLGVVTTSNLSVVDEVARLSGPVLDADWLEEAPP